MKKNTIILAIGVIIVAAIILVIAMFFPQDEKNISTKENIFSQEGNLVRNNPGMMPDTWYLLYEGPGSPALSTALAFTDNTLCYINESEFSCEEMQFTQGDRVEVKGVWEESVVELKEVYVKQSDNTIKLFFYNPALDEDAAGNLLCSKQGLVFVQRELPKSSDTIKETLQLLLKGDLTQEEKDQGITTEFPLPGLILKESRLNNGILTLTFDDTQNKTVGGSCRVGILWQQIQATAKQFPQVNDVRFMPEDLFQP